MEGRRGDTGEVGERRLREYCGCGGARTWRGGCRGRGERLLGREELREYELRLMIRMG